MLLYFQARTNTHTYTSPASAAWVRIVCAMIARALHRSHWIQVKALQTRMIMLLMLITATTFSFKTIWKNNWSSRICKHICINISMIIYSVVYYACPMARHTVPLVIHTVFDTCEFNTMFLYHNKTNIIASNPISYKETANFHACLWTLS